MFNQKKYEELIYNYMSAYKGKNLENICKLQIMDREKEKFLRWED